MKWILAVLLFSSAASAQSPNSVLIPAAGHVQGANGTFFKSDIAIHNLRPVTQVVRVEWLPQTGTGRTVLTRDLTLLPNGVAQSDDFVEGIFSTDGLGSIVVHPIHSDGSADPAGELAISSRIWTAQPGGAGNVSQSFPAITLGEIDSRKLAIVGLRSDAQHRVNIGIVNLDRQSPQTFRITMPELPGDPIEVIVAPYSMQQVPLLGVFAGGRLRVDVEIVPQPGGILTQWIAYGSVVDNYTGDSWSSIGRDTFFP